MKSEIVEVISKDGERKIYIGNKKSVQVMKETSLQVIRELSIEHNLTERSELSILEKEDLVRILERKLNSSNLTLYPN